MNNKILGNQGEALAANYLIQHGYAILAQNYRIRSAELDLVVKDGNTIAFVEVKTRRNMHFGSGAEAVNYRKQKKIIQAAQYFLQRWNLEGRPCRFDVIEIYKDTNQLYRIHHLKNAFESH
ncbi:YraN family protein [uncultured Mitsuokella sp.]|uniref:YraN family protein n=1 Tax=uncultured Mitsuokella sp. TaxID=453120 RepID=UPI00260E284A|nr:YraN family protein [uncultured Mitsuokella sp.]